MNRKIDSRGNYNGNRKWRGGTAIGIFCCGAWGKSKIFGGVELVWGPAYLG